MQKKKKKRETETLFCKANFIYIYIYIYIFIYNFCDFVLFYFVFFFLLFSLILHFWKSNLYSRFLIFAFWYLLSILYLWESNLQYPFYLGARLLAWLLSLPLNSPFSPPGLLCLLPPPSLLYTTLWISLCVPGCGEHLGNWLLAGSVSLLLIPPFILLATSVSFLPLLFSV